MIGQVLMERYIIEELVGTGGMSDVYRGLDLNTGRRVAIKILKDEFAKDEEFLRRFQREAQAAAALSHENLVGVYDLGHEDGIDFIVMEYVAGDTLKERIQKAGALPMEVVLRYGVELCSALEHAHEEHIIHRDIKPQNIIISGDGSVKLTDFGIARATTSMTLTMTDGSVMGSVHYFSPEQAKGEVAGEPSDLYSLGIVLYEMATGRVPFTGDSPVTLALQHLQEPPPDPARLNPMVLPALSKIILKALRKDIMDRYQSAAEMKADLMRVENEPEGDYVTERKIDPNDPTRRVPIVKPYAEKDEGEEDGADDSPAYERQEGDNHRRRTRFGSLLVLLMIVIACGALVWIGIRVVSLFTTEPLPTVPNLESMTLERAQEMLREREYIPSVDREYHDTIGEGLVIFQNPAPDTQLPKHSVVAITISRGPEFVTVPQAVGLNRDVASDTLKSYFLVAEIVLDKASDRPRGEVIKQEPVRGSQVENGSTVLIYVSDPPLMRRVPDLSKLTPEKAIQRIEEAGLELGEVKEYMTTDMEAGIVYRQSPEAGTEAVEGSAVDLYISAEPVELFSKEIFIDLELPDYECEVQVDIKDEEGKVRQLYKGLEEGGAFQQSLMNEEKAGTYQIIIYVDGTYWDSWDVKYGKE